MQIIKGTPTKELIEQIVADTNDKAKMEIMQFSGMDDKTLSGVFAELSNHITVFATSDDLQRALSGEGRSITPADIEGGYDIFCCIPEHKLEEWKDLLGMMCNQFLKSFERRGEGNKTPILFLIDEFRALHDAEDIGGAVLIGPRNIALVAVVVFVGHHIAHTTLHRLAVEAAAAGLVEGDVLVQQHETLGVLFLSGHGEGGGRRDVHEGVKAHQIP